MTREVSVSIDELEAKMKDRKHKQDNPPNKRQLVIKQEDNGLYTVGFDPAGGMIPLTLQGMFTTRVKVEAAIEHYKRIKGDKEDT